MIISAKFCRKEPETLMYLFCDCEIVVSFWNNVSEFTVCHQDYEPILFFVNNICCLVLSIKVLFFVFLMHYYNALLSLFVDVNIRNRSLICYSSLI